MLLFWASVWLGWRFPAPRQAHIRNTGMAMVMVMVTTAAVWLSSRSSWRGYSAAPGLLRPPAAGVLRPAAGLLRAPAGLLRARALSALWTLWAAWRVAQFQVLKRALRAAAAPRNFAPHVHIDFTQSAGS